MRTTRSPCTAWTTSSSTVITRAMPSSGAMPSNGIRHWLASALSIVTVESPTFHTASQPNSQPILGFASRDAHW